MSIRKNPPAFPLGFAAQSTDEILILDFVDAPNGAEKNVFFSVALNRDIASEMLKLLVRFIEDEDEDEDEK
ncbi:Uncharacterised protein [Paucimonas lemoignei]|nr:Uncharacterised protein [Paucimonas lemoignei]